MRSNARVGLPPCSSSTRPKLVRVSRRWATKHPFLAGLSLVGAVLVPWLGMADTATETRYPFDPACPWGRLANGKGMITRCLGEEEARALLGGATITTSAGTEVRVPAVTEAPKSSASVEARTAGDSENDTPEKAEPPKAPPAPPPEKAPPAPVNVEIGPLVAEDGELTIGQLGKPLDRYRACVEKNGGLSGRSGEVRIHFLVRGERSRAEAVEVEAFRGVTKQAAQCIADVVDRRATGTPSQPMVGATLVFKLSS